MPKDPHWISHSEILTFEEITRIAKITVLLGIEKIRLTGGEPTVRRGITTLIKMLKDIDGLKDISLTTNGMLLKDLSEELWNAGLRRINVSLDTLNGEKFIHIARIDAFDRVIAGLREAERVGFSPIKVNMVVIRGFNEDEILEFASLARTKPYHIRFIEFMPLDGDDFWSRDKVVTGAEIIEKISTIGGLIPKETDPHSPAKMYKFVDGIGDIGIIASVSEPFCMQCDRIRLTADGKFRNCLFATSETDIKDIMRNGGSDDDIADAITKSVREKWEGHLINSPYFEKPERAMYAIGG